MIEVYTDGSCLDNTIRTNRGGNGFLVVDTIVNHILHTYIEHSINTTNNREELKAVINALEYLKDWKIYEIADVTLYSDSQYCVNGINEWSKKWKNNNWNTFVKSNKPIKNQDLWIKLDDLLSTVDCNIEWIKGHQKEENYNTIIDELLTERLKF